MYVTISNITTKNFIQVFIILEKKLQFKLYL